jgi:hypothetical protein
MFMSAKLDRLVVGSILKQEGLSKSVSDRCEMQIRIRSISAVTYLAAGIRRERQQRTDDGWALIMRVIK